MKEVISENLIFINTHLKTQSEVFDFLEKELKKENRCIQNESIKKGFYAREQEFSTYIDNGIAIPHCRHTSIIDASVAIIINDQKINWTQNGEKADIFISLMIPEKNENQIHIRVLAQVAQLIMEPEFIQFIKEADNEKEIYERVKVLNIEGESK